MPKIIIPSRDGSSPKECTDRKPPVSRGSYYEFEISLEDHRFWKMITNEEREEIRSQAFKRCFYEVLHDYMKKHPRKPIG